MYRWSKAEEIQSVVLTSAAKANTGFTLLSIASAITGHCTQESLVYSASIHQVHSVEAEHPTKKKKEIPDTVSERL